MRNIFILGILSCIAIFGASAQPDLSYYLPEHVSWPPRKVKRSNKR